MPRRLGKYTVMAVMFGLWGMSALSQQVVIKGGGDSFTAAVTNSALSTIVAPDSACYVKAGVGTSNDTTNHANCKSSGGVFKGARAINTTATIAYLRMYNLATDPSCGSSTGFVEAIPIPANTTGAGFIDILSNFNYTAGISYCVTANGTNNDNTAPVAGVYITIRLQ